MAHTHSVYDSDTHFTINPITRALRNTTSTKTTVIQYDHNSERFTFEIPRYIENHDMSLCNFVQVHYINIDAVTKAQIKGAYEVDDMRIDTSDNDVVICSWLISRNATQLVGSLNFLVRFACVAKDGTVDYVWNTAVYTGIGVSSGIDNGDVIAEEYPDILAQWKAELEQSKIVDPTLTIPGAGADAKETGDKFRTVNDKLKDMSEKFEDFDDKFVKINELQDGTNYIVASTSSAKNFTVADDVNATHVFSTTKEMSRPTLAFCGDDGDQPVCLTNIAAPINGRDVVNKHYVDDLVKSTVTDVTEEFLEFINGAEADYTDFIFQLTDTGTYCFKQIGSKYYCEIIDAVSMRQDARFHILTYYGCEGTYRQEIFMDEFRIYSTSAQQGGCRIGNVLSPQSDLEAANKRYVDDVFANLTTGGDAYTDVTNQFESYDGAYASYFSSLGEGKYSADDGTRMYRCDNIEYGGCVYTIVKSYGDDQLFTEEFFIDGKKIYERESTSEHTAIRNLANPVEDMDAANKKYVDDSIPKALPNPNALTFTGAASGSYDGSKPLEIDIPQGGSDKWEFIGEFNSGDEDIAEWIISEDAEGKPIELKQMYCLYRFQPAAGATKDETVYWGNAADKYPKAANAEIMQSTVSLNPRTKSFYAEWFLVPAHAANSKVQGNFVRTFSQSSTLGITWYCGNSDYRGINKQCLGGVVIYNSSTDAIGANSTIKIWGVRL